MVCPKCLHTKTNIFNSRFTKRNNQTWRRHRCLACGYTFSTREYIAADQLIRVRMQADTLLPFSRTKLLLSIAKSFEDREDIADVSFHLTETVEQKLLKAAQNGTVDILTIVAAVLLTLEPFDTKAYLRYLSQRSTIRDSRDLNMLLKRAKRKL